jgi:hypothetical protein
MYDDRPDAWLGQHLQEEQQMKTSDMTQSKYMKAADLDEDTVVTVTKVGQINLAREGATPDMKWAIRFKEFDKPMVLNKTNIKRLEKALGDETDLWSGKQVVLFVDEVDYQGDLVPAIRIKAHHGSTKVKGPGGSALSDMESDVPFRQLGREYFA